MTLARVMIGARCVFFALGLAFLAKTWHLTNGDEGGDPYATAGVGIVLLILAVVQVRSFRIGPVGAEVEGLVRESRDLMNETRRLAALVGEVTLMGLRRGELHPRDREDYVERIQNLMGDFDIERGEYAGRYESRTAAEYLEIIREVVPLNRKIHSDVFALQRECQLGRPPGAAEIAEFLKKAKLLTAFGKRFVDDYRYFLEHGTHADTSRWESRDRWPGTWEAELAD